MRFYQATPKTHPSVMRKWVLDAGHSEEEADSLIEHHAGLELYLSDDNRYQVAIDRSPPHGFAGLDLVHLSIKRTDKRPIHDWRDLQEIKNALVGPECEGIELYPAESRRVDSANQYHLYVFTNPEVRTPCGFLDRLVTEEPLGESVQRPFARKEA